MRCIQAKPTSAPSKEEVFVEPFGEYSACFALSKMFGWSFDEKSRGLIKAIEEKASKVFGFSPSEFSEWVERQPRETVHGTIPVPGFSEVN